MSLKLIFFLLMLIAATLFIGVNLDNRCNISILFYVFENVPIFVSLLFAYVFGALSIIPFLIGKKKKATTISHTAATVSPAKIKKEQKIKKMQENKDDDGERRNL